MRDMSQVLDLWGAWAASESSGVNWQPVAAGFKNLLPESKAPKLMCDDDLGIVIDSCIGKLKILKPDEYDLIIGHYLFRMSLRSLARKRKCSDGTLRKELQRAEGFIEGCLNMLNITY